MTKKHFRDLPGTHTDTQAKKFLSIFSSAKLKSYHGDCQNDNYYNRLIEKNNEAWWNWNQFNRLPQYQTKPYNK